MLAFEFAGGWNDMAGSVAVTVLQFLLGGGGSFSAGGPGAHHQPALEWDWQAETLLVVLACMRPCRSHGRPTPTHVSAKVMHASACLRGASSPARWRRRPGEFKVGHEGGVPCMCTKCRACGAQHSACCGRSR